MFIVRSKTTKPKVMVDMGSYNYMRLKMSLENIHLDTCKKI